MPMGKGTYGSKRGRPKKKNGLDKFKQPSMKGRKGAGGMFKRAGAASGAASKSRYDKILYGNTKRKKK